MLDNNKKIIWIVVMGCMLLIIGCSKTELIVDEGGREEVNDATDVNEDYGDVKSQLENILRENNIDGKVSEYKQINNVDELARKYPVLYEGLPNGVYEVRTAGLRLMIDIKEKRILKTFNDVSVSLG